VPGHDVGKFQREKQCAFSVIDILLIWNTRQKSVAVLIGCALFVSLNNAVCLGAVRDMTNQLPDDYLGREFPWAFVLDLPDANSYLKYPGSKLWPITKVRVNLRSYSKNSSSYENTSYEELWYHYHLPAGLRRYSRVAIAEQSYGAIIVCPGDGTADPLQRPLAIADAIVRLVVDIQMRHASTALVLVPDDDYECIVGGLSEFHFFPASPGVPIQSLGIHLRAYPGGSDQRFYLQKQ
jgi:hypothetical protein